MATSRKNKARKEDFISKLPENVKERILECLPTRDAARTSLLSTHWNDVWLRHGRLVFDSHFFEYFTSKCVDDIDLVAPPIVINKILMLRVGPVKKFTLSIAHEDPEPDQDDIDLWCLFLSRNGVEELNILAYDTRNTYYNLPLCMFSCRTIKKLTLLGVSFYLPINARSIFPGVTSLAFEAVEFKRSDDDVSDDDDDDGERSDDDDDDDGDGDGERSDDDDGDSDGDKVVFEIPNLEKVVFEIPNLEKLAFRDCDFINSFEIRAPKLKSLSFINNNCKNVAVAARTFPTYAPWRSNNLNVSCRKELKVVLQLLQKSPNLCDLEIGAGNFLGGDDKESASMLLKDLHRSFINQDMKMLNNVKIVQFKGSNLQMHFVKSLLSKSPALEKVVINISDTIDTSTAVGIQKELLSFPCASLKAQILFLDYKPT